MMERRYYTVCECNRTPRSSRRHGRGRCFCFRRRCHSSRIGIHAIETFSPRAIVPITDTVAYCSRSMHRDEDR